MKWEIQYLEPELTRYDKLSAKQLTAKLKKLENSMYDHARNLEFEEAAQVRDQISKLKEHYFKNDQVA